MVKIDRSQSIALNNMRGISALAVACAHCKIPGFADLSITAVAIFFLITGMVIPQSIAGKTLPQFAISRFFRIFPVLFTVLIIAVISKNLPTQFIIPYLFLIFDFLKTPPYQAMQPVWTLAIEVHFYILLMISFGLIRFKLSRKIPMIILCLLVLGYFFALGNEYFSSIARRNLAFITYISISTCTLLQMSKYYIFLIYLLFSIILMSFAITGFIIPDIHNIFAAKMTSWDTWDEGMISANYYFKTFTVALVAFYVMLKYFTIKNKILSFLSDISYPLYLIHSVIFAIVIKQSEGISDWLVGILSILVSMVLSVPIRNILNFHV